MPNDRKVTSLKKLFDKKKEQEVVTGKIKRILLHPNGYRYGFIVPDTGGKDIYFHERFVHSKSRGKLVEGISVETEIEETSQGLRATFLKHISKT